MKFKQGDKVIYKREKSNPLNLDTTNKFIRGESYIIENTASYKDNTYTLEGVDTFVYGNQLTLKKEIQ